MTRPTPGAAMPAPAPSGSASAPAASPAAHPFLPAAPALLDGAVQTGQAPADEGRLGLVLLTALRLLPPAGLPGAAV